LLFLEYEFTIIYKQSRTHVVTDALSRLPNNTNPIGVPNHTINVALLMLQLVWLEEVKNYLQVGQMPRILTNTQKQWLARIA